MLIRPYALTFVAGFGLAVGLSFKAQQEVPDCSISLPNNNYLYTGIDYSATILVKGYSDDQVRITGQGITVEKTGANTYKLKSAKPGLDSVTVEARGQKQVFTYISQRIVTPAISLNGHIHHFNLKACKIKISTGLKIYDRGFKPDCECKIVSYDVFYKPKEGDTIKLSNTGAEFSATLKEFIKKSQKGDMFYFKQIKVLCPGDLSPRTLYDEEFNIF
jgi:hypothetical protein